MKIRVDAFTTKSTAILRVLNSEVHISHPFDPKYPPESDQKLTKYIAIWDTGATGTAVTQKVVNDCDLKPIGVTKISTANEEILSNVYLASIFLPNKVCIPQLRVTEISAIKNADILIGMDIISHGDFAITNKDGKTTFSFRIPSIECIDFVKQNPPTIQSGDAKTLSKVGRNAPCPCGSGKKYKHCCGK